MTPAELNPIREEFEAACRAFGWTRKVVTMEHDRDWASTRQEGVWVNDYGDRLFKEDDLEHGLAFELIRIAENGIIGVTDAR